MRRKIKFLIFCFQCSLNEENIALFAFFDFKVPRAIVFIDVVGTTCALCHILTKNFSFKVKTHVDTLNTAKQTHS